MIMRKMRRPLQPTARRMPISRVRSKTDMTIVFMTPMAPMPTARTEIARLAASSMFMPWSTLPYSETLEIVARLGNCVLDLGGDVLQGRCPDATVTKMAVTTSGLEAISCTVSRGT